MAKKSDAVSPQQPDTFFDLSFRGGLPDLLRALASRLEAHDCTAESFQWNLDREHLVFTARIDTMPKE